MADFRAIFSQLHLTDTDEEEAVLDPGTSGEHALWGGSPNGETVDVQAGDAKAFQPVDVEPPSHVDNLRVVRFTAGRMALATHDRA